MSNLTQFLGGQAFDPSQIEGDNDFEVLPPGKYPVEIEKTSIKATRKGDGNYVSIKMVILDGPGKGRKLYDNLNIDNPNPEAVKIAYRQLKSLNVATVNRTIQDTDELVGGQCLAIVKIDAKGDNAVKGYKAFEPATPVAAAAGVATAQAPPVGPVQPAPAAAPYAASQPPAPAPAGAAVATGQQQPGAPAVTPQNGGVAPWDR
jgi:hypothetical protein